MKNKPYVAFDPKTAAEKDNVWVVPKNLTKRLYDGRYSAVSGFIFAIVNGKYSVLANKRGKGTPDFQGLWNCPCGFLERDENSREGIKREIYEECGVSVPYNKLKIVYVETEPALCNNGNVTIRHKAFLGKYKKQELLIDDNRGGEKNEVENIKWIPIDEVDNYEWAFGHKDVIKKYAHPSWIRKILEFLYGK